ncbi:MAG: carbohydrate-binding domain-containing protein [Faecalibacterium prausnitzii]
MLSYRKLAMRVLGRPLHTGGIDSPRPASQRAAAFILTAAMLTTLAAPAFADIWHIEDGDITVKAGETGNDVTQKGTTTYGDTDTIITNSDKNTASSHTVTIEANDKDDKVEVTLKDVNIDTSSRNKAAVSVTGSGNTTIKLDGDNALKSDSSRSGIYGSGSLTITGGENDSLTAQGGSGANGIYSSGSLTISGGTVTANGGDGDNGIYSSGSLTISGGSTVTANGGNGTISGGNGIYSDSGDVTISGGTVKAAGGNGSRRRQQRHLQQQRRRHLRRCGHGQRRRQQRRLRRQRHLQQQQRRHLRRYGHCHRRR